MLGRSRTVTRVWPDGPGVADRLCSPRADLLTEQAVGDGTFAQVTGPFSTYERRVAHDGQAWRETTRYRLAIPWFGWLFGWPVRMVLARRLSRLWWAPPDHITPRHALVLGLLAAASMSSAFVNTLFTQTAKFAADDFGIGNSGVGVAGAVVRAGIIITIPFAVMSDRIGRRGVMRLMAWLAPLVTAMGALAPNFAFLVATQAIGRPLGLALDFLIAVVAAEEMPRNSRAYAVSLMAMASGLGAGIAVMALPLADLGESGWRLVYVVTLVWLVVAVDITRRLPETRRFEHHHQVHPTFDRRRFAVLAAIVVFANFFVAPAAFFQNSYLRDIRGYDASTIAIFTLVTATPAGLGLVVGGRLADVRGRRMLIAGSLPLATVLIVASYAIGGPPMWLAAFGGGFLGGIAYPALAVYRAELFPTGNRGKAAGFLTVAALLGGIVGLLIVGRTLDAGSSYAAVISLVAIGQLVVVVIVLASLPETAHRELEDLNPQDRLSPPPAPGSP